MQTSGEHGVDSAFGANLLGVSTQVVPVRTELAGIDAGGRELRVGIPDRRLLELLQVVAEPGVHGDRVVDPPLVLDEEAVLADVRMRRRAGRAVAGERLQVALACGARHAELERRQAVEGIGPAEVAGEEIEDSIAIQVATELHTVTSRYVGQGVGELNALDRCFAWTEIVTSDDEDGLPPLLHCRFGFGAVGLARFFIAQELTAHLVEDPICQDGAECRA